MIKNTDFKVFMNLFPAYVVNDIESMLVLGVGELRHEQLLNAKHTLGVDWCDYQLAKAASKGSMVLKYDIVSICDILTDKSFDVCVMFDFIEHLEKHVALKLLADLESKIRKQIIMFTPIQKELGYTQDEVNRLQMERKQNNSPMGYHLSLWTPADFEQLGYIGEYSENYHTAKNMGAIFCVKNL
jgi:hypothetical protein